MISELDAADVSSTRPRRVIVDTDTAGDDTQALMLAATSDELQLEGVKSGKSRTCVVRSLDTQRFVTILLDMLIEA